jgi:chemotaxis protein MotB
MVEPVPRVTAAGKRLGAFLMLLCVAAGPGCGLVPKSRLDECHRLSQTLRADNNRLRDVALDLRAQNQDLNQRAVDDARRIALQEEALERLEKSVQGYQSEREQIAREFEVLERQVRRTAGAEAATLDSGQRHDP